MGLQLHNPRPRPDNFTYLTLSPLAEVKTCIASIGSGSIMADIAVTAFKFVAMPAILMTGMAAIVFLATVDYVSDKMVEKSLDKGHIKIKQSKRPKIDI